MASSGDGGTSTEREQRVASLVYDSFRPHVTKVKHLASLFPESYVNIKVDAMEHRREHRRKQILSRRNISRMPSGSEVSGPRGQTLGIRRTGSTRSNNESLSYSESKSGIAFGRTRSAIEPALLTDSTELSSRLQIRRSTNAYLEVMWARFFGQNQDVMRDSASVNSQSTLDDQPSEEGSMDAVLEEHDTNLYTNSDDASKDNVRTTEDEYYAPSMLHDRPHDAMTSFSYAREQHKPIVIDVSKERNPHFPSNDSQKFSQVTSFDISGKNTCLSSERAESDSEDSVPSEVEVEPLLSVPVNQALQSSVGCNIPDQEPSQYDDQGVNIKDYSFAGTMLQVIEKSEGPNRESLLDFDMDAEDDLCLVKHTDVTNNEGLEKRQEDVGIETFARDQLIPNPWQPRYSDSFLDSNELAREGEPKLADASHVSLYSDNAFPEKHFSNSQSITSAIQGLLPMTSNVKAEGEEQLKTEGNEKSEVTRASACSVIGAIKYSKDERKEENKEQNALISDKRYQQRLPRALSSSYSKKLGDVEVNDDAERKLEVAMEKWNLINKGGSIVASKSYGSTNSTGLFQCHERKKSIKIEKLKLKRTIKICCIQFAVNW